MKPVSLRRRLLSLTRVARDGLTAKAPKYANNQNLFSFFWRSSAPWRFNILFDEVHEKEAR